MTTAVSLDIETWGKRPGCDIRSIGACVMNLDAGSVAEPNHAYVGTPGTFYIACDNPQIPQQPWYVGINQQRIEPKPRPKYPLTRDPDTVQWWSEQSPEAQAAFSDAVELREALERLSDWLSTYTPAVPIYAHGPQFDLSILEAAYHAVGLPVPWHYRAPRDTRTLMDAAQVGDHSEWMSRYSTGTAHHALDDAICQARAMCAAWALVAGRKREALDRLCDEERGV